MYLYSLHALSNIVNNIVLFALEVVIVALGISLIIGSFLKIKELYQYIKDILT